MCTVAAWDSSAKSVKWLNCSTSPFQMVIASRSGPPIRAALNSSSSL